MSATSEQVLESIGCRVRRDIFGRMTSIICDTDYGRIVIYQFTPETIDVRLMRPRGRRWVFVRPTPRMVQIVCSKHFEETYSRKKYNYAKDGEMTIPLNIERGAYITLPELVERIAEHVIQCRLCNICFDVRWESTNCGNMCHAGWEVTGIEVRPVPPAVEAECRMEFEHRVGGGKLEEVVCECEPLRVE